MCLNQNHYDLNALSEDYNTDLDLHVPSDPTHMYVHVMWGFIVLIMGVVWSCGHLDTAKMTTLRIGSTMP